ncbi:hypothetical protein [Microbacterium sp. 1P10AE]|uniref:hypothetical protein n=1 Tax=Microbacterium sp. 1P10AE TaxID=3132286 RepID=UPI0039A29C30
MPALARVLAVGSAAAALVVALSGCVPEPSPTASPTSEASVSSTPSSSATPKPSSSIPSPTVSPSTALPASCDDVYSDAMLTRLQEQDGPLNDPGVSLLSTDQASLLELLDSIPTLRCSWGPPGEKGLSTNVSIVDATQAAFVRDALSSSGFGCDTSDSATICRLDQRGVSLDDVPFERGEVQAIRGEVWVTTSWINFDPEGYTEDILSTVAG